MENNFFWKKCLKEKRTEGYNSIVSEVPFFFKSLITLRKFCLTKIIIVYPNAIVKIKEK